MGAQVDGAFEGRFKDRGLCLGEADHRARRALFAGDLAFGELDLGAGGADVGVSTISVGGMVTAVEAMLAFAGVGGQGRGGGLGCRRAWWSRRAAGRAWGRRGGRCSRRPGRGVERLAWAPSSPETVALTKKGSQLVGLRVKPGRFSSMRIERRRRGMPSRILGEGIGDGGDLGGFGVDVKGGPHHGVAEVIGTGDGGGDHGEGKWGAPVGAGEVDLALHVDGVGAGAGSHRGGADQGGRQDSWGGPPLQGQSSPVGRPPRSQLGAVGDPGEGGGEAGWGGDGEAA